MKDGYIIEDAVCTRSTPKAILVESPDLEEPKWIPKSVIHELSEVYGADHEGTLIVQLWWAKANDLDLI
jgi:hypothetical protein